MPSCGDADGGSIRKEGIDLKTGLVLEGGAMRGMFTVGALDVLMECGVTFDGIIGVSAGACFGCNYKSNQPGRAIRYNMKYSRDPRYCGLGSLIRTGDLYGADFCYREIPMELDKFDYEAFRASPTEFYVVCTDVRSGEAVYQKLERGDGEDLEWMRASASMPLVSRVVRVGGRELLDGGVADSVPLRYFQSIGYDKNVVILTQPRNFVKQKNQALPVARIALRKYPALLKAMERRHLVYNESTAHVRAEEAAGRAFVIAPDAPLPIKRTERDPEKLRAVYQLGRENMERRLEALQEFLRG